MELRRALRPLPLMEGGWRAGGLDSIPKEDGGGGGGGGGRVTG